MAALNAFLEDLYVGERAAVRDGIVPWWLVTSSDGFVREAVGVPAPSGVRCLVAGLDLVRGADGRLRVLEDNLRNPSGMSYVVENRDLMTRLFPSIVRAHRVRPVGNYGELLLRALRSVAPAGVADPCVVVMTPGIHNAAYFEHAFLAHQMGVELVEGNDLLVDGQRVYMRTTEGPRPVHVIYRRLDDRFLDPVGFRSGSYIGVPGLLTAARAGTVTLANAVGNGVADDKAVYPFVPDLVRYYLNEEPLLPNVGTYLLWDDDQRAAVLDRLDELVTKPVDGAGGYGLVIGPRRHRRGAGGVAGPDRGRPPGLHLPGGREALAGADRGRGRPRRSPRRPAALRHLLGRRHRGPPRRPDPGGPAQGLPDRQLLPRRRHQGHVGPRWVVGSPCLVDLVVDAAPLLAALVE